MTVQIGDIYRYQNKKFTIVAMSSLNIFNPRSFGLEPHTGATVCWRGYWCEYDIVDDELRLKDLYLFNADGNYPPINGTEVSNQEFEEYESYRGNKKKCEKVKIPANFGHRVYRDINMLIPYSGRILLGNEFMDEYYIHMGFQRGWAYRKLIELVFEEGILMECNDISYIAEEKREAIKQGNIDLRLLGNENISKFVEDSFSLDYADKAWWIE